MISLFAWSKLHELSYSMAQKMFNAGSLVGAIKTDWKIMVPEGTKPPERQKIECRVCGRSFPQITSTHLQMHDMTVSVYKATFPGALIVSAEISKFQIKRLTSRVVTEAHCQAISDGKKGKKFSSPWYSRGAGSASDETREKMSVSQTGRKHSLKTKQKMSDWQKGVPQTQEIVQAKAVRMLDYYKNHESPLKGYKHTNETRQNMAISAQLREGSYTPEKRAAINKAIGDGGRGIRRTPEQIETYRASRVKWMHDNPAKVSNTKGELVIKAWLEDHLIDYEQQFVIAGMHHPYDFFLPAYNTIIEFDGPHHWRGPWFKVVGTTPEEREARLQKQRAKDAKENLAAGRAGLRIIRVLGTNGPGDGGHGTLEEQLAEQGFPLSEALGEAHNLLKEDEPVKWWVD